MPPFLSLHAIAAQRGDGLLPEFLAAFKRLAASAEINLTESGPSTMGCMVQSGPDRRTLRGAALPEGVLRFPADAAEIESA